MNSWKILLIISTIFGMLISFQVFTADEDDTDPSPDMNVMVTPLPSATVGTPEDAGEPVYYPTDDEAVDYNDD